MFTQDLYLQLKRLNIKSGREKFSSFTYVYDAASKPKKSIWKYDDFYIAHAMDK
jgi:hypothetical protein